MKITKKSWVRVNIKKWGQTLAYFVRAAVRNSKKNLHEAEAQSGNKHSS
jgi:hypothetical protein